MRWRKPPEPSSSFQECCRLRRGWGYFGELGSNPAWRGRVGTTIPLGLGIWEASGVQARSSRGPAAREQSVGLPYRAQTPVQACVLGGPLAAA